MSKLTRRLTETAKRIDEKLETAADAVENMPIPIGIPTEYHGYVIGTLERAAELIRDMKEG